MALAELAARVAEDAGVDPSLAARIYLPMMRGALENLERLPPAEALTGPVRRGDVATVVRHLAELPVAERETYAVLGMEAVRLAEAAGLEAGRVAELRALLRAALP